jgi:hypothetical protein
LQVESFQRPNVRGKIVDPTLLFIDVEPDDERLLNAIYRAIVFVVGVALLVELKLVS